MPGVKTEQERGFTDRYNTLLTQLAGKLGTINHENQHTHTLIEQVGQAVEALKKAQCPARAGAPTYLYARHQILENISDDVRHAGMYFSCRSRLSIQIARNNQQLAANDLKYRYVKMRGEIKKGANGVGNDIQGMSSTRPYAIPSETRSNDTREAVRRRAEQLEQASIKKSGKRISYFKMQSI